MEIYLIRHTKPAIKAGICYGQMDVELHIPMELLIIEYLIIIVLLHLLLDQDHVLLMRIILQQIT